MSETRADYQPSNRLAPLKRLLLTLAHLAPRGTHQDRQARAALVAVVVAIHNDELDKLLDTITGFLQDELSWIDAMVDGEMFDLLSAALIELGAVAEDFDEAQRVTSE